MHSDLLTLDQHLLHPVHKEFTKRLGQLKHPGFRVLDWGCGRGSDVLHLRKKGLDAYGAEISTETIERGKPLFDALGLDHASLLKPIGPDNSTDYPSSFFAAVISYQVLEHVEDLDSAAREMYRIMEPGGVSIHLYPAHHRFVEGHLHMPLVHWLPKSGSRRRMIQLYTLLGVEPHWKQFASLSAREKADRYFLYSVKKTFYRAPRQVREIFDAVGFESTFESHKHERVVRAGLDKVVPSPLLAWLLTSFGGCVFVARKPPPQASELAGEAHHVVRPEAATVRS